MLYLQDVNKDTIYSVPKQSLVVLRQISEIYFAFMRYLLHLLLEECKRVQKCINAVDLERFVPLKDKSFQFVH